MANVHKVLTRLVVIVMVAGSLATAGSGVADAAAHSGGNHARHGKGYERKRICQIERRRLAYAQHEQQRYAAQTRDFVKLERKAAKAGETAAAAYWAHVVTKRNTYSATRHARLQARIARDVKRHGLVGGKCT